MKTVYTNKDDIIHLFSNNIEHDIRSTNMSVRVYNDFSYLYSYATVIAKHDHKKDVYLISTRSYSVTTSKQQSMLNWSIAGDKIYIYDVNDYFLENINSFKIEIIHLLSKHKRARQNKTYIERDILNLVDNMKKYIIYQNVDLRKYGKFLKLNTLDDIEIFYTNQNMKDKKKKEKEERERKRRRKEEQKLFNEERERLLSNKDQTERRLKRIYNLIPVLYHNDKMKVYTKLINEGSNIVRKYNTHNIYFDTKFNKRDYLKVTKKGNIITSQNVTIPVKDAKRFYSFYKARQIMTGDKISHYSVNDFNQDLDFIRIGCHIIDFSEIDYIAKKLNFEGV